jgi:hypothetical protein
MADEKLIVEATPEEIDKLRGYSIGVWGKRKVKNYMCIYCQYATLWQSKMNKHQAENDHPWAFPGQNQKPEGEAREYNEPEY